MSDNPATKLLRLTVGYTLLRGRLGHQALGQLLLSNCTGLTYAASSVITATATNQPNKILALAVHTGVPVLARLAVARKLHRQDAARASLLEQERETLEEANAKLHAELAALRQRLDP